MPSNIYKPQNREELISIIKTVFNKKSRYRIVYTVPDNERRGITVSLENLNEISKIDKINSCITFECGAKTEALLKILSKTPYATKPFNKFPNTTSVGEIFTHRNIFKSDSILIMETLMPDGTIISFGNMAYTSVAGYNAKDLFLGTKNMLGTPIKLTIKLRPTTGSYSPFRNLEKHLNKEPQLDEEERKILLKLKNIYDPVNLLNTREI